MEQVLQVSAINVVVHPHPAGVYERLMRAAFNRKQPIQIHGDRYALMSQVRSLSFQGEKIAMEGEISTFSKLDLGLPWFNTATSKSASQDDLMKLAVPENLQPNHRTCFFYFDLTNHRMIFESMARKGGLAPRLMLRYLENLFKSQEILNEFGNVTLTIAPEKTAVSSILQWKAMRRLYIHASRPNPGDYDPEDFRRFEESLRQQGAKELNLELVSDGSGLTPNEDTQTLAGIAADNGYVEAKGTDQQGHAVTKSTKTGKPLLETGTYDPGAETLWDAFRRVAQGVSSRFRAPRASG